MTEHSTAPAVSLWDRIPTAHRWALLPAVLGLFVQLSVTSSQTANGAQTSCSFFDVAGLLFAVALVAMAVSGVRADRRRPAAVRLGGAAFAIAAAYVLIAAYHFVTAIGIVGGPCN